MTVQMDENSITILSRTMTPPPQPPNYHRPPLHQYTIQQVETKDPRTLQEATPQESKRLKSKGT